MGYQLYFLSYFNSKKRIVHAFPKKNLKYDLIKKKYLKISVTTLNILYEDSNFIVDFMTLYLVNEKKTKTNNTCKRKIMIYTKRYKNESPRDENDYTDYNKKKKINRMYKYI